MILLSATGAFINANSCIGSAAASPAQLLPEGSLVDVADLRLDLDYLVGTYYQVAPPNRFMYTDRNDFYRRFHAVRSSLNNPMTMPYFWLRVAPVMASLNDGHAWVRINRWFYSGLESSGLAFALSVDIDDHMNTRVVAENGDLQNAASLPIGSQILEIDGRPMNEIRDDVLRLCGGQTLALRKTLFRSQFPIFAYLHRSAADVVVKISSPDEGERRLKFKLLAPRRTVSSVVPSDVEPYLFSRLAEGSVGYIAYNRCEDLEAFKGFMSRTFLDIQKHAVRGVVIDIRRNSGGDSDLNDVLWSYFTSKPFRQEGGQTFRVSERVKHEYGREKYELVYGSDAWSKPDGAIVTHYQPLFQPATNTPRFNGPVFLLVGPATFSSAIDCATAAKDYGLATLVGEPTAAPVNSTGELYVGKTPRAGLPFGFPTEYQYSPTPRPPLQGLIPDFLVASKSATGRSSTDEALSFAVKRILDATPN